jgi:hypothetical protein
MVVIFFLYFVWLVDSDMEDVFTTYLDAHVFGKYVSNIVNVMLNVE